jgi:SAM-dependent methyltransferase
MAGVDRHNWDERYAASERTFPLEPNRLVAEEVGGLRPGRALDLAAGEGRHAVWLAAEGWDVVAVDHSIVGLRRAQARARAEGLEVAFAVADVHHLRFPPRCFDLILAAFFHPRPPERAHLYRAAAGALAPGGTLLLVSYDLANLTEGSGGPQDAELLLQPDRFGAELRALGLHVGRADTVRLRVPAPDGGEVDVVDAVIRAIAPARAR